MKTVYLINRFAAASSISERPGSFRYIVLNETIDANRIRGLFAKRGSCEEIDAREVRLNSFTDLRKEFIAFIGRLNASNASLFWWAYFISNKNPALVPLFYDVSNFLVIDELLKKEGDDLVVIADRIEIAGQLKHSANSKSYAIRDMIEVRRGIADNIDKILPVSITAKFIRLIWRKILMALSGYPRKIRTEPGRPYTVIRTMITENCFSKDGSYRDTYFGDLPVYLERKGRPTLIVAALSGHYGRILKAAEKSKIRIPIIPIESLLTLSQAVRLFIISFVRFFKSPPIKGETSLYGADIKWLLEASMRDNIASSSFFSHADSYFSTETLMKKTDIARLLYPMENRPWERMMILSSRVHNPRCRVIGYQHASIGQKHMNFVISDAEEPVVPIPDEVIATGQAAKEILEGKCNMRRTPVKSGCALRYSAGEGNIRTRPKTVSNILVTLAASLE